MDCVFVRFTLIPVVVPLLAVGSKSSACRMAMANANIRVLSIDRLFFLLCVAGLMEEQRPKGVSFRRLLLADPEIYTVLLSVSSSSSSNADDATVEI